MTILRCCILQNVAIYVEKCSATTLNRGGALVSANLGNAHTLTVFVFCLNIASLNQLMK